MKFFTQTKKTAVLVTLLVFGNAFFSHGLSAVSGSPLVRYSFLQTVDAEFVADGLRAGSFTSSPEIRFPSGFSAVSVNRNEHSLLFRDVGFDLLSKADAIARDRFLSFDLTVEGGRELAINGVYLRTQRRETEGEGAPSAYAVYAFTGDKITPLGVGRLNSSSETAIREFQEHWLDVGDIGNLSGNVEIRLYFWTPQDGRISSERAFRLDEVALFGAIR
jgi:hypothetical protein